MAGKPELEMMPDTPGNRARAYAAELRDRADRVEASPEIMRYEPGTPEFEQALDDAYMLECALAYADEFGVGALGLDDDDE